MKLTLHKLKVNDRASQETLSFTADVHIDGKLAFAARNTGEGGACYFEPAPGQMPKWPKDLPKFGSAQALTSEQKKVKAAHDAACTTEYAAVNKNIREAAIYARSLPIVVEQGIKLKPDLDSVIHGMAWDQHVFNKARQQVKRKLAKELCWLHASEPGVFGVPPRVAAIYGKAYTPTLKAALRSTHHGQVRVILNEIDIDEATRLLLETNEALTKDKND
jgi:hypothetical protein